jgi:hypothetical protein
MQQSQRKPVLHTSENRYKPLTIQGKQITPISHIFQVRWPNGTFLWLRPVAIEVRQGDVLHRLPIPNTTRRATINIIIAELALVIFVALWMRQKNLERLS